MKIIYIILFVGCLVLFLQQTSNVSANFISLVVKKRNNPNVSEENNVSVLKENNTLVSVSNNTALLRKKRWTHASLIPSSIKAAVFIVKSVAEDVFTERITEVVNQISAKYKELFHDVIETNQKDEDNLRKRVMTEYVNQYYEENNVCNTILKYHSDWNDVLRFSKDGFTCNNDFCEKYGNGLFGLGICTENYCQCRFGTSTNLKCGKEMKFDPVYGQCDDPTKIHLCKARRPSIKDNQPRVSWVDNNRWITGKIHDIDNFHRVKDKLRWSCDQKMCRHMWWNGYYYFDSYLVCKCEYGVARKLSCDSGFWTPNRGFSVRKKECCNRHFNNMNDW